jgi:cytochrome c oxidase assembly protein subunit 15
MISRAMKAGSSLPSSSRDERAVGIWLVAWAILCFAIVLVGGATRLTESGLSITEWKPVTGIVPPHTADQWMAEFEKYQRIPQYQRLNAGMSLEDFKAIYLWEFWHRIVARLAGLAFALPFAWFALRRRIPPFARGRIAALLALLLVQGAMGWWMVSSGLSVRTEVSQYRLAAHLTLAFVLLGVTVWTAADLLEGRRTAGARVSGWRGRVLPCLVALVGLTSASGALVAGLRAGRVFNSFPLMAGRIVPPGYSQLSPWWRNLFENPATVQFDHRVLALTTFCAVVVTWATLRRSSTARVARRLDLALTAAMLQLALGISTLLLHVPVSLGVAHQGGGALLLVALVLAWHADVIPSERSPQVIPSERSPQVIPSERSESRDPHLALGESRDLHPSGHVR